MKRRHRLRNKERFRHVKEAGASYAHPYMVLCSLPNHQPISRCGFTAGRRVGKAVERNRARRRMSEAVRLMWDTVQPGWDLVWIARSAINQAEFLELQGVCERLLRRAGALRAKP